MWVFEEMVNGRKLTEIINTEHENVKYLPGHKLPSNVVSNSMCLFISTIWKVSLFFNIIDHFDYLIYFNFFSSSARCSRPGGRIQRRRHFGVCDSAPVYQQSVWHHEGQDKEWRCGNLPHQGTILSSTSSLPLHLFKTAQRQDDNLQHCACVCVPPGRWGERRRSQAHLRRDRGQAGHHHECADGGQHCQRGRRREVLRDDYWFVALSRCLGATSLTGDQLCFLNRGLEV